MVICLERGADLHMAQLMPLPLTVSCFSEIQIGLPFWYRFTRVVPDKGPLNGCVCLWWSVRLAAVCVVRRSGAAMGEGEKLPPYVWTSKNYVICVCFHCHGTSSYHTTNTLQGRRAKSHVDTQTIQPGLGDFVLTRSPIDPHLTPPLLQNPGGATGTTGR